MTISRQDIETTDSHRRWWKFDVADSVLSVDPVGHIKFRRTACDTNAAINRNLRRRVRYLPFYRE